MERLWLSTSPLSQEKHSHLFLTETKNKRSECSRICAFSQVSLSVKGETLLKGITSPSVKLVSLECESEKVLVSGG